MIELDDVVLAIAVIALVVGLGMIYLPLALILPGAAFIGWTAWRQWPMRKER